MSFCREIVWGLLATASCALAGADAFASDPKGAAPSSSPVEFYEAIKPLLAVHCYRCHGSEIQKSDLRLDLSKAALAGGKSGLPAIVPGSSGASELFRRITSADTDERMPPKGEGLSSSEAAMLKRWIDEGANWPDRDQYWAFSPPLAVAVPHGNAGNRFENPIDRFLNARLKQAGIMQVEEADHRTLLRRAFADLAGVPPSLEEAGRFLADRSPDAYEKLIDRLLSDPRYGERWARHWLDLARYGESDGYEDDKVRPHAWRYRDYVIRSFNADKPYDLFIQEQIAGNELWPDDPDAWIATGFARLGAWDGMSKEPAKQRQDFLNDATDALGSVFLGVTIGCARCHDHKYDVITQADYYRLQAFFASVKRGSLDLKESNWDSPAVKTTYHERTNRLSLIRSEREKLLQTARDSLTAEKPDSKNKIEEAEVKKGAEKLQPGRLRELESQIKRLDAQARLHAPRVEVVIEEANRSLKTWILKGGEIGQRGAEVQPGFIEAFVESGQAPSIKSDGPQRAALARWLADRNHPLTSRVMVNRIWQHHFGVGIVATPSDFGRNGRKPTHPELLDWLAHHFVEEGFSIKQMHRLIMTSAAYRRSSSPNAAASAIDPENKLLWRMNRRRLEGEAIRDSILAISGTLRFVMGGPGIYAPLPANVAVELPNNDKDLSWEPGTEQDDQHRSIYLFQRRSLTFPLIDVFDAAPMSQSCAARPSTTVAPQALALFNGEFSRRAAADLAERLRREAGVNPAKLIHRAFQIALTREPSFNEREEALRFLKEQTARRKNEGLAASASALVDFCHVILNTNELIYTD